MNFQFFVLLDSYGDSFKIIFFLNEVIHNFWIIYLSFINIFYIIQLRITSITLQIPIITISNLLKMKEKNKRKFFYL